MGDQAQPVCVALRPGQDVVMTRIRASRPSGGAAIREIEQSAGGRFRAIGMESVAEDEPLSEAELAAYAIGARSWVAVDAADHPVGYVLVDEVDGNAHVAQISVVPESLGQGIGRALLDRVRTWAIAANFPAITLTTFNEVPWNRRCTSTLGSLSSRKRRSDPTSRRSDETNPTVDSILRPESVCVLPPVSA